MFVVVSLRLRTRSSQSRLGQRNRRSPVALYTRGHAHSINVVLCTHDSTASIEKKNYLRIECNTITSAWGHVGDSRAVNPNETYYGNLKSVCRRSPGETAGRMQFIVFQIQSPPRSSTLNASFRNSSSSTCMVSTTPSPSYCSSYSSSIAMASSPPISWSS
jgi:hypothetical protein